MEFNYSGTNGGGHLHVQLTSTIEGRSLGASMITTFDGYHIGVDYSFTKMDLLNAAHRITLQLRIK